MQIHQPTPDLTIYEGHVLDSLRSMPDKSVHCIVTSDPYWGLRDYGEVTWLGGDSNCDHGAGEERLEREYLAASTLGATGTGNHMAAAKAKKATNVCPKCCARRVSSMDVDWPAVTYRPMPGLPEITVPAWFGAYGLEPTPEMYVGHSVLIRRELWRVLRDDGTQWLNLGDSYSGSGVNDGSTNPGLSKAATRGDVEKRRPNGNVDGLKPKDMCGIPWRVAFALQADGWYLRSDVIWSKPNPMPESVTDRPTKAHEYVFLLTKSPRYFYDADAIREAQQSLGERHEGKSGYREGHPSKGGIQHRELHPVGRNKRSVWTIPPSPFPEAHFATFPEEIPRLCILAGTSPQACPHCGAPWERVVERVPTDSPESYHGSTSTNGKTAALKPNVGQQRRYERLSVNQWKPTCSCNNNDGSGKCVTLDPFGGSMTTPQVALELGRKAIACELNPEYIALGLRTRLQRLQPTLLGSM